MASKKAVADSTNFRVYRIDNRLRDSFAAFRTSQSLTVAQALVIAANELPAISSGLRDLGVEPNVGKVRPARWPLGDSILKQLKSGSETSGVPQSVLLIAAVRRATRGAGTKRRTSKKAK